MKIPYISGEWKILFKPEKYGNYVNDHTIVKGSDNDWHLYGITSFGGQSYQERYFALKEKACTVFFQKKENQSTKEHLPGHRV